MNRWAALLVVLALAVGCARRLGGASDFDGAWTGIDRATASEAIRPMLSPEGVVIRIAGDRFEATSSIDQVTRHAHLSIEGARKPHSITLRFSDVTSTGLCQVFTDPKDIERFTSATPRKILIINMPMKGKPLHGLIPRSPNEANNFMVLEPQDS